jgi:hypothetical protein
MQTLSAAHTHFIYRFQINPDQAIAFQYWAQTRGMSFWETLPGVVRYRTFRQGQKLMDSTRMLSGRPSPIDVISQVEISDRERLDQIFESSEFQQIQQELLNFVRSDSLEYSILDCAYDSGLN